MGGSFLIKLKVRKERKEEKRGGKGRRKKEKGTIYVRVVHSACESSIHYHIHGE
jgi:hypothetical protein